MAKKKLDYDPKQVTKTISDLRECARQATRWNAGLLPDAADDLEALLAEVERLKGSL